MATVTGYYENLMNAVTIFFKPKNKECTNKGDFEVPLSKTMNYDTVIYYFILGCRTVGQANRVRP